MLSGATKQSVAHCAEAFRDNVTLFGTMCGTLSELIKSIGTSNNNSQPLMSQKSVQKGESENSGGEIIVIDD